MRMHACIVGTLLLASAGARAEQRVRLPPGAFVLPVAGPVRVLGSLRDRADGSVVDAVTDRRAGASPGPGLLDWDAGGLRLVRSDENAHAYAFEPTGRTGRACVAVGLEGACLVGRPLPLAVTRLITQDELVGRLDGGLELESAAIPVAPVGATVVGRTLGSPVRISILSLSALGLLVCALAIRWRRSRPRARALRALRRLEACVAARPVYAGLLDLGADLVRQLDVISAQRAALRAELARCDDQHRLERRARAIAGLEVSEAELVMQQLGLAHEWRDRLVQCDARSDRIATHLEITAMKVGSPASSDAAEQGLLGALSEELTLAQESVRAADRLLSG